MKNSVHWQSAYFACMMLLMPASHVHAQIVSPESDIDWRKSPKPLLQPNEKKQTPAHIPPIAVESVSPIWSLEIADGTLSNTLSRWSRQEKWQLLWEAERDFPILATVYIKGSFQNAILTVMQSLSDTDYPMQAIINPDTRVIRIVRYMQTPNG